jgi:hypothetical protein
MRGAMPKLDKPSLVWVWPLLFLLNRSRSETNGPEKMDICCLFIFSGTVLAIMMNKKKNPSFQANECQKR